MRAVISILIIALVFVAAVLFVAFNSGTSAQPPALVQVNFLGQHQVTVIQLGVVCFLVGMAAVAIFLLMEELVLRSRIGALKRKMEAMRKEINALRNLPLAAEILGKDIEDVEEAEEKK